jgi:hypothetical protein
MRTTNRVETIEARLTGFETRVTKRFDAIDQRFEQVDQRFEQVDKRFEYSDQKLDAQQSHFDALFEEQRTQFQNLFDLIRAQDEGTTTRFERLEAEIRAERADLRSILKNHERRLVVLEDRVLKPSEG